MKKIQNIKYWIAGVLSTVLVVGGCMTIEEIIHPEDAQVDQDIEISVRIKLVPETDNNSELVFAVLAPKSWNLASNAELSLSTTGYTQGAGAVINEKMTLMSDTETEPTTAKKWSAAFQSKIGLMGNLGPVEWVAFKSATKFIINDKTGDKEVQATIKIKLRTGPQAIKLFMGYTFCGKDKGFDGEKYKDNATKKVLEVEGGTLPKLDYTTVSLVSTIPSTFGFGDIFSVVFEEEAGDTETALKGAEKVYLYGRVIYDGGQEKEVTVISSKTLMEKLPGTSTWQKYIYPREFFGLPANAVIEKTYFHFTNEDKSITVKDGEEDFLIMESAE